MLPSILILDDDKNRIDWIKKQYPGINIIWTYNTKTFFEGYQKEYDKKSLILILLDHDLGLEDESGMDIVNNLQTDIPTIVWSVNTVAGTKMFYKLKDKKIPSLYIPYIYKESLKKVINEFEKILKIIK